MKRVTNSGAAMTERELFERRLDRISRAWGRYSRSGLSRDEKRWLQLRAEFAESYAPREEREAS